jgi:hypothetical protein
MAKTVDDELFQKLRVAGLRKKVARELAGSLDIAHGSGNPPEAVRDAIDRLKALTAEIEDRAKGGPARRRSHAAQKAAATRKRRASERSAAARKAARTRARAH